MNAGPESSRRDAARENPAAAAGAAVHNALRRLLVPIDATERSRWGIGYVRALHAAGKAVEAALLNVGEPVTNWQVLRFRTHDEIARFQAERARYLLDETAQPLAADGIPCRTLFREGEIVFEILDAAEQLECSEIVLPKPPPRPLALLSRDIVRAVVRQRRSIPVVIVDKYGSPNGYRTESGSSS